jgi:hypothetical protein
LRALEASDDCLDSLRAFQPSGHPSNVIESEPNTFVRPSPFVAMVLNRCVRQNPTRIVQLKRAEGVPSVAYSTRKPFGRSYGDYSVWIKTPLLGLAPNELDARRVIGVRLLV